MLKRMGPNKKLVKEALAVITDVNGRHLDARIRDIDEDGICCFLSQVGEALIAPGARVSVSVAARGHGIGPLNALISAVERSWVPGYEIVVTCRFENIPSESKERLSRFVQSIGRPQEIFTRKPARARKLPEVPYLLKDAEVVQFVFPARFSYIEHFRNACEKLAEEAGFDEFECHQIKVAADELFSNALHHGSTEYGKSRIFAKILLSREGIVLCVRDQSGVPFDHEKYREEIEPGDRRSISGLRLIDKVADDWVVTTEPGKFTLVCIYKRKRNADRKAASAC